MARTITLRLSDAAYEPVKRYADADQQSINSWIEGLFDVEDMLFKGYRLLSRRARTSDARARWIDSLAGSVVGGTVTACG